MAFEIGPACALARGEIKRGGRNLVATGQQQAVAVDCHVALNADAFSQFRVQVPGRIVLPTQLAGFCIQRIDVRAIVIDDSGGAIGDAIFDHNA